MSRFEEVKNNRKVRKPRMTLAVPDHNVPTTQRRFGITDAESKIQVEKLMKTARNLMSFISPIDDLRQGIVHIIGPRTGICTSRYNFGLW